MAKFNKQGAIAPEGMSKLEIGKDILVLNIVNTFNTVLVKIFD